MADLAHSDPAAEVGEGFLSQASALVYRVLVLQGCFLVAASPGIAVSVLLRPDPSNAVPQGLALVPLAPALSALLYGWQQTTGQGDLQPARHFWTGYRGNVVGVLLWWLPAVAVLTMLMINIGSLTIVASGPALALLAAGTIAGVVVIVVGSAHALVITSLFSVRARDLPRLLPRYALMPGPTLGALALAVSSLGLAAVVSDWILIALAAPAVIALHHFARPVIVDLERNFVR